MAAPPPPPRADSLPEAPEVDGDDYVAPVAKSIGELLSTDGKDGEDEALQQYKASLLGAAAISGAAAASDDPRRVVITELSVLVNGREPLVFDMTDATLLNGGLTVKLQEGCEYKNQLTFRVQNELVSGLKYRNVVSRGPLNVLKVDEMLGSYAPDPAKTNIVIFPRREWENAPAGMMARGTYTCKTEFVDDDKNTHLTFSYKLVIGKDW